MASVEKTEPPRISRLYADSHLRQLRLKLALLESVDGGCGLQIYLLPITLYDALTNLRSCLSLFVHGIGVIELLQTDRTLGAVGTLETAVQTIVTHAAIAVAIAGL